MSESRHSLIKREEGVTIVEALVATVILGLIVFASMELYQINLRLRMNSAALVEFNRLTGDLEIALGSLSNCVAPFKETLTPLTATDYVPDSPSYSRSLNYIYSGTTPLLHLHTAPEPTGATPLPSGMKVSTLELRSKGLPSVPTTIEWAGSPTPVTRHFVDLAVEVERPGLAFGATTLRRNLPISIYTAGNTSNPGNNRILGCSRETKGRVETAIASRSGFTINAKACVTPVAAADWEARPLSDCPSGDANYDSLCDGVDPSSGPIHYGYPHKGSVNPDTSGLWPDYFPNRQYPGNPGVPPPPLGSIADEGRCWVSLKKVPSTVDAKDVFLLLNGSNYLEPDGIGCNRLNGWMLTSCVNNSDGYGDADAYIKTINGNEYCVTEDYQEPHASGVVWTLYAVHLVATCTRVVSGD